MIRLRIERDDPDNIQMQDGIWYWEDGAPVGRVIIEQSANMPEFVQDIEWVPVEVIDEV